MLFFELYRQLDNRLYRTISTIDKDFRSCGKYVMDGDCLILAGTDHSVRINICEKRIVIERPYKNLSEGKSDIVWLSEESGGGYLIRMICNSIREWYEIDPFNSFMEFEGTLIETNKKLGEYGLSVFWDRNGMTVYTEAGQTAYEDALSLILEGDGNADAQKSLTEWMNDARYYKSVGQEVEAIKQYESLLRYLDRSMDMYTEAAFALGELYYFNSNYERSVEMYKRCNLSFIEDLRDFYVHLGHALLDVKMKNYVTELKIYYRSRIDSDFCARNRRAVDAVAPDLIENYPAYEDTCYEVGLRKYDEYTALIPVYDVPDTELIVSEKDFEPVIDPPKKRYEQIKLVEHTLLEGKESDTNDSLLKEALDDLNEGEYQKAFQIYLRLFYESSENDDIYTWVSLQIGKLYIFFNEFENAIKYLDRCRPDKFGVVYRADDHRLLTAHARIAADDFESEPRFRILIRGKYDSYFARYDREYYFLRQDKDLMSDFVQYEDECIRESENRLIAGMRKKKRKSAENSYDHL
ncbi:MAG: hypothetical protein K5886_00400 [Lachnospiraceae bacterium]|nr:hypothetical protein [Lachnospiraceae bacterium]